MTIPEAAASGILVCIKFRQGVARRGLGFPSEHFNLSQATAGSLRAIALSEDKAIAPYFSLLLEIRGYAAVFGSIIETSLSAVLGICLVIARSLLRLRFLNRSSFDLLRRDGPCRLPVCLVHRTHLLCWDRMTFYLRKAAERISALPLMLRSS